MTLPLTVAKKFPAFRGGIEFLPDRAASPSPRQGDKKLAPSTPDWDNERAAFFAGLGCHRLGQLLLDNASWRGVWLERRALAAAEQAMKALGRVEDRKALRDLYAFGGRRGIKDPASAVLHVYVESAIKCPELSAEALSEAYAGFGYASEIEIDGLVEAVHKIAVQSESAVVAAALAAIEVLKVDQNADVFAFWVADLAFALTQNWPCVVPLLSVARPLGALKNVQSGIPEGMRVLSVATHNQMIAAIIEASYLRRRALALVEAAVKVRALVVRDVVHALLAQDCLPGSVPVGKKAKPRAMRRIFERLQKLGVIDELTRRPTGRLYGL